jgi:integrase
MHNGSNNGGRKGTRDALNDLLERYARIRENGNVASYMTAQGRGQTLHTCFNDLWDIGYRIANPENLSNKHVEALCQYWYKNGKAVSTIQGRLSVLRVYVGWIGKRGMVKKLPEYLPHVDKALLKVSKVAKESKSWTEQGIDVLEKINLADAVDPIFGLMLRMCLAFGLRLIEVLQFDPHISDLGDKIRILKAKNGRQRDIDIEHDTQREVLDMVKQSVQKGDHMGWKLTKGGKVATLKYSRNRYNKCMAKIGITKKEAGVTGHGLRAQYAELAALAAGMIPPTLGGKSGQMDKVDLDIIRAQVSEKLGHRRISVLVSYHGSFGRHVTPDEADRCKTTIECALQHCHPGVTKPVPEDRVDDCAKLVKEMEAIGVEMTLRQAQLLWEIHSHRYARYWVSVGNGNAEAMEAAANTFIRQIGKDAA